MRSVLVMLVRSALGKVSSVGLLPQPVKAKVVINSKVLSRTRIDIRLTPALVNEQYT